MKRRGIRFFAVAAALIAVLFVSLILGAGRENRVFAVGNARAESGLERLRGTLSHLIDPILPLLLEERTTYAPGFREEAFRALRNGMTETDIRQALGDPLSTRSLADGRKILYYSEQATPTDNYLMRLVILDGPGRLLERHAEFYID